MICDECFGTGCNLCADSLEYKVKIVKLYGQIVPVKVYPAQVATQPKYARPMSGWAHTIDYHVSAGNVIATTEAKRV